MSVAAKELTRPCDLGDKLKPADVLLVVPPFSHFAYGSLACHLLQAEARQAGISVSVLYANLLLANILGEEGYKAFTLDYHQLIGERLFRRAAYGGEPFGDASFRHHETSPESEINSWGTISDQPEFEISWTDVVELESVIDQWIERVAEGIVDMGFKLVGCTSAFQQTTSSVALLNAVKRLDPDIVTMIGGSNCEDEMAEGIVSLRSSIDYVFSGESDATFPHFVRRVLDGHRPDEQIVRGSPCHHLDALPTPNYDEFFAQLAMSLPQVIASNRVWVSYETSRGCWWGEKAHCTFCGLNGSGMAFREKSADRVIEELSQLIDESPTRNVMTTDNIMPNSYFRTLLPRMGEEIPGLNMHFEIKANLNLEKVTALHQAGVHKIQPGIEALSSSLLKRMQKGVTAAKNIDMLRFCRMYDMDVRWNLLCHFPGDNFEDYEQTLALVPLLTHLAPPTGIFPLSVDRFSPYYFEPELFDVTNIRPASMYAKFLPEYADVEKIAYHFEADYEADSRDSPELIEAISAELNQWIERWDGEVAARPQLFVQSISDDRFLLVDTRRLAGLDEMEIISRSQAEAALMLTSSTPNEEKEWALNRKLAFDLEGRAISLAACSPQFMLELQAQCKDARTADPLFRGGNELASPMEGSAI